MALCIIQFHKYAGMSELLYNEQRGSSNQTSPIDSEMMLDVSKRIKIGLLMYAQLLASAAKFVCTTEPAQITTIIPKIMCPYLGCDQGFDQKSLAEDHIDA